MNKLERKAKAQKQRLAKYKIPAGGEGGGIQLVAARALEIRPYTYGIEYSNMQQQCDRRGRRFHRTEEYPSVHD